MATSKLREAEQLIREARHGEALTLLKGMSASRKSGAELAYYHVLLSETALIVGEPGLVGGLDEAIEYFRFRPDTAKFARAKYVKGLWYVLRSDLGQAQETLLEAYSNFLRCQDFWSAARSLNRLSYAALNQGDVDSALDFLEKSVHLYESTGDHAGANRISGNLSLLYTLTGRLKDSIAITEKFAAHTDQMPELTRIIGSLIAAESYAHRGETKRALAIIAKCKPQVYKYPREELYYWQFLGAIYLLQGNYGAAENVLLKGLKRIEEIMPDFKPTSLRRLLADTYCFTKRFDDADRSAQAGLKEAEESNERSEMGAYYRIFGRIDYSRKNYDTARAWFDKAMDLFGLMKFRYELATTLYEAARTDLYSEEEKARKLGQAREYFKSEEIKHYLDRVDDELRNLTWVPSSVDGTRPDHRTDAQDWYSECPNIVTATPEMRGLLSLAKRAAPTELTVLLTGETGTGKDLLAKYIHYHSGRSGKFVSINAAAVPDAMVESELFGYMRGAFTGADSDKPGLFEIAHEGTFYLNEIADATPSFQAKLLEVIETRTVRRLGYNKERVADFRLIAATNQNIEKRVSEGHFRADLYHRLNEVPIYLPPLSDRSQDILPLTELFLRTSGFHPDRDGNPEQIKRLSNILAARMWAGNIRQLRAEVNYLLLVSNRDLSKMIRLAKESDEQSDEYLALLDALNKAGGNKSRAARALGIPESTLRYRLKKYRSRS